MKKLMSIAGLLLSLHSMAQDSKPDYPQNYFRNPLDIPIFLAGNFGECRPGHFHSGTDIKTQGEENQKVHAAADGYISRIKMEKGGFGHALYITHPNGYTTLYAHLNNFAPQIQRYLKEQQYKQHKWNVDLQLSPSQFPVKKGDQIAWSGNTGASTAPHLHFEIRNTKTEHPLNPELFGLPIVDNIAPVPAEVAIYDMSSGIYEQNARLMALQKKAGEYVPKSDTLITDNSLAGIGVNVDDYMNGSDNTIAYYTMQLYMDDALQTEIKLDDIGYDETRYINAFADYKTKWQKGRWVQYLFKLPGNRLDRIYPTLNSLNGALNIADKQLHKIRVEITDDKGNKTTVRFALQYSGSKTVKVPCEPMFAFKAKETNTLNNANLRFTMSDKALYDNICFDYGDEADATAFSDRFMLHHPYVPVHDYFKLGLKANKPVPFDMRDKIAMMYNDGKSDEGSAAKLTDQGWYECNVRDLGIFWLAADTTAPDITSLQKNGANLSKAKQITFKVRDNMTSVKSFEGKLDGEWICFEQHTDLFFYKFDEHCSKGKHKLVFTATDENGNSRSYQLNFTR
jgi:hypothetical protein